MAVFMQHFLQSTARVVGAKNEGWKYRSKKDYNFQLFTLEKSYFNSFLATRIVRGWRDFSIIQYSCPGWIGRGLLAGNESTEVPQAAYDFVVRG